MSKIIQRATIIVNHVFVQVNGKNTGPTFKRNFQVGFDADEVIVRSISYGMCTNDNLLSYITTDLIKTGDGIIGIVSPNAAGNPISSTYTPNSKFTINKNKINSGIASFSINCNATFVDPNNFPPLNMLADGTLMMLLEFVKYETK